MGRSPLLTAEDVDGEPGITSGVRLVEFTVEHASWPGRTCFVPVAEPDIVLEIETRTNGGSCVFADGDRISVRADELRVREEDHVVGTHRPRLLRPDQSQWIVGKHIWLRARSETWFAYYWRWVAELRQWAWHASKGQPERSFVLASTLGYSPALSPSNKQALRAAGLGHLLAVSGLHVSLVAFGCQWIGRRLGSLWGRPQLGELICIVAVLLAYAGLTGFAGSVVRASVMLIAISLARCLGRVTHSLSVLVICIAFILAFDPSWARDIGFQLSIVAMFAIVTAPASMSPIGHSWRLAWCLAPLSFFHFSSASLYGVLANLVAIPVFSLWVLPLGLLGTALRPVAGETVVDIASWGASPILDMSVGLAQLPETGITLFAAVSSVGCLCWFVPRLRAWGALPPIWACAGVLVAFVASQWTVAPTGDGIRWVAQGKSRAFVVLGPGDEAGEPTVCVDLRHGSTTPRAVHRLLELYGNVRVATVLGEGPDVSAVVRAFGLTTSLRDMPTTTCASVDEEQVEGALSKCQALSKAVGRDEGRSRVLVRERDSGFGRPGDERRIVECWLARQWHVVSLSGPW